MPIGKHQAHDHRRYHRHADHMHDTGHKAARADQEQRGRRRAQGRIGKDFAIQFECSAT